MGKRVRTNDETHPRRVTHQDVANRLGLHKSTVSLALRGHPKIAANTRERVKAMAEQMGFRPDPALEALARQRWAGHETGQGTVLAYVIDSRMEHISQHRRFLPAARQRAQERGYLVHEFDLAEYTTTTALARVLHHRGIRGLMLAPTEQVEGPGILDLPVDKFTVVCLDVGWVMAPFHLVSADRFEATRLVWREAVKRGYRRIGGAVLSHAPAAVDDASRYGASAAAQEELLPLEDHVPLLTTHHWDREGFLRWLDRYQPDAVVGFIPRVLEWIVESGRRVPEDVAFGCITIDPGEFPQVSGATRLLDDIGATGVDALIAAIQENEWGVPTLQRKLLLEPRWHEGATLPVRTDR